MRRLKSIHLDNIELLMTLLRPFINTKEWAKIAKQYPRWFFVDKMKEERGETIKQLSLLLKKEGHTATSPVLTKAYEALVIEFSEWYYSHKKFASTKIHKKTDVRLKPTQRNFS